MRKASDVMTRSLTTCAPNTPVSEVAAMMRDRDIGDVLVVDHGQLRGIVTDRDLAVQALTGSESPQQSPVRKYMSKSVVTGHPDWRLDKVAGVMARHQIRRLPIVRDGQVAGIVSLGDVARHSEKKQTVAQSLEAISATARARSSGGIRHAAQLTALAMLGLGAALGVLSLSRPGRHGRPSIDAEALTGKARNAIGFARNKIEEAAPDELAAKLIAPVRAKLSTVAAQLTNVEPAPKRRRFWFA